MRHSTLSATEHYTHVSPGFMQSQAGGFSVMVNTSESLKVKTPYQPLRAVSSVG